MRRRLAAEVRLLLERRGPDGRTYFALTGEGWDRLRRATPVLPIRGRG